MINVNATADITIIEPEQAKANSNSPKGKAYLQIACEDASGKTVIVNLTLNLAGMIGGSAKGTAARYGYQWYPDGVS